MHDFGIYACMIYNCAVGSRRVPGNSLLYKSDAANTLPLSGAERSLRVKSNSTHVFVERVLLSWYAFLNGEYQMISLAHFCAVFSANFKTLDVRHTQHGAVLCARLTREQGPRNEYQPRGGSPSQTRETGQGATSPPTARIT